MRLIAAFTTFLLLSASAPAQEIHSAHCLYGCPSGSPATNDLIVREIYVISSNDDTKFADWAAYVVTAETISRSQTRTWKADPSLDDVETLEPDDYKGANAALKTDRGHQVPLASFTGPPPLARDELPLEHHTSEERAQSRPLAAPREQGA